MNDCFCTGCTFLHDKASGLKQHLWTIISDFEIDDENVVILNFTTNKSIDPSCVIAIDEHPFIKEQTYVNYRDARIVETCRLNQAESKGLLHFDEKLESALLARIQKSAGTSPHTPNKVREFLANQGIL